MLFRSLPKRQREKIKKVLKEARKERQRSAKAQASSDSTVKEDAAETRTSETRVTNIADKTSATSSAQPSGSGATENAENICWKCSADVTNVENSKCAGCRKVTFDNIFIKLIVKCAPSFPAASEPSEDGKNVDQSTISGLAI